MFENIGKKLQILATVVFVIGMIGTLIYLIVFVSENMKKSRVDYDVLIVNLIMDIVGTLVVSFLLGGIGKLVENTGEIINRLNNKQSKSTNTVNNNYVSNTAKIQNEKKITEHIWRCPNCDKMINTYPCEYCGHKEE